MITSEKFDSLIFDIDGTLWNASAASAVGWTKGLSELGINRLVTKPEIESVAGNPYSECIRMLIRNSSIDLKIIEERLNATEKQAVLEMGGDFYAGVKQGMKRLAKDFQVYLVSNCQDWYYDLFMEKSNLKSIITDSDCHGRSLKSKAHMIRGLVKKYGMQNPVYIGDTRGDFKAAQKAEVTFFHAAYGFGDLADEPIEARFRFESFDDIVRYLL